MKIRFYTLLVFGLLLVGCNGSDDSFSGDVKLKSYRYNFDFQPYSVNLTYNQAGDLISRVVQSEDGIKNDYYYNYDDSGRLVKEDVDFSRPGGTMSIDYSYDGSELSAMTIDENHAYYWSDHTYDFTSDTDYTHSIFTIPDLGPDFERNYVVDLEKDSEGRTVKFAQTSLDNGQVYVVQFEYTNGNLTKIWDDEDVFEIVYDEANNFHTYQSNFQPEIMPNGYDYAGLIRFDAVFNVFKSLLYAPSLFTHVNMNNPVRYTVNGEWRANFNYVYNSHNYPTKIIFNDSWTSGEITVDLTYY
ncbi:MAG: hypothetical protein ABJM06_14285 [Gilvibacter sp.]